MDANLEILPSSVLQRTFFLSGWGKITNIPACIDVHLAAYPSLSQKRPVYKLSLDCESSMFEKGLLV